MSSSQQQYLTSLHPSEFETSDYETVPSEIKKVHVALVDKIQDRFPELNIKTHRNYFQRKRVLINSPGDQTCNNAVKSGTMNIHSSQTEYSRYVQPKEHVLFDIVRGTNKKETAIGFIRAGPRENINVFPVPRRAAIVCSGSLCPGQNEVVSELFNCLYYNYGFDYVYGIKGGFSGFYSKESQPWSLLTPDIVQNISGKGGSVLGYKKGGFDAEKITNACLLYGIQHLFIIGGDGSHIAAHSLDQYLLSKKVAITVCCVPNSIENDIGVIDNSFGFHTAVSEAVRAIQSVTVESSCSPYGIGMVRVMGRHSGFIAAHATLASTGVDLCLLPELPFQLYDQGSITEYIGEVLKKKGSCVIVIAEGSGVDIMSGRYQRGVPVENHENDYPNMGLFLKKKLEEYFNGKNKQIKAVVKYNDPSIMIRSVASSSADNVHCLAIAHNAVHASLAGYTNFSSSIVNNRSVLIPIKIINASSPNQLSSEGRTLERMLSQTQQPTYTNYDSKTICELEQYAGLSCAKL